MAKKRRHIVGGGFCQDDFKSRRARRKPAKALLIVTEGRNTEPSYFEALKSAWNIHPKVLSITPGCEGVPGNLVNLAIEELAALKRKARRKELAYNELDQFDEVWIVFDTEHAQRQEKLHEGVEAASTNQFQIAHSTPCFEFWLALHFAPDAPPMDFCDQAIAHLEKVAGLARGSYSKSSGASKNFIETLMGEATAAVRHASQLEDRQKGEDFPANPSTGMHRLLLSIYEALPEDMKQKIHLSSPSND